MGLILLFGLVLRIALSSYWTYEPDFGTFKAWAIGVSEVGFSNFYGKYWCDYMPGYICVLWLFQQIHTIFPGISDEILFKLPANLSDLGISILIFFALKRITTKKIAVISSIAYFLNPASLSNSTFWGQIDSVHALPILLSIVLGLNGNFIASGIFAALAFMIKPQSIVIFPLLGIIALKPIFTRGRSFRIGNLYPSIKIIFGVIMAMFIVTLPFTLQKIGNFQGIFIEPVALITQRFSAAYGQYDIASLNAFNFWGMVAMWQKDSIEFLYLTYKSWGTLIFGVSYGVILLLILRFSILREEEERYGELNLLIFQGITLTLFALFLFVTRAHERHFLPTVVFFTLIAFRSWLYWMFYGLISVIYFVNMSYAYLELTHRIKGIPPSLYQTLVIKLVPGLVLILIVIFVVVFVDFLRNSLGFYNGKKALSKGGV